MNNEMPRKLDNTNNSRKFHNNFNNRNFYNSSFKNSSYSNIPNVFEENINSKKNINNSSNFDSIFESIKNSISSNSSFDNFNNNSDKNFNDINNDFNTNNINNSNSSNPFSNLDIGTILKAKSIMDKMGNLQNDPRSNLLLSLKPYLKDSRKEKVDQYIKIFSMTQLFENLNGGEK